MMAERLDSFEFSSSGTPGSKYDKYMDGGIYRLVIGEDIRSASTRVRLVNVAKKHGKKLHCSTRIEGSLVIQAYVPEKR